MPERYSPLPAAAKVFRTARLGGGFLPTGHVFPLPQVLEPSRDDVQEAEKSGRAPGVSVWDRARASHDLACWFRGGHVDPTAHRSFTAGVGPLRDASERFGAAIDVITDPIPPPEDRPPPENHDATSLRSVGEGHSLLEGIPPLDLKGLSKAEKAARRQAYYDRLQILLDLFAA